ncbi:MAG: peptide chain release factor N(5)-glutamine methyltransferase [Pseudomonadota bacterium]
MTITEALAEGRAVLADVPGGVRDARWLLAAVLKIPRDRLTLERDRSLSPSEEAAFREMLAKRADRVPVSHLTGSRDFYGRSFVVTRDVLDPRPETEALISAALEVPLVQVLDIGTGSGAILLTLLAERKDATGVGTDISIGALAIAEENARRLAVAKRARMVRSDWFSDVDDRYDLIVSNPPYIPAAEMADLAPELGHEPRMALTDEGDGLASYRALFSGASRHLAPGGRLIVEFGAGQGDDVAGIARGEGWADLEFRADLDARPRVLIAKSPL